MLFKFIDAKGFPFIVEAFKKLKSSPWALSTNMDEDELELFGVVSRWALSSP